MNALSSVSDLKFYNMMVVYILFIIAHVCSSDALLNTDVCLTWNAVHQDVVVDCKVFNQVHAISIAAPFDQNLVTCYNEEMINCKGSGIFSSEKNGSFTTIKVKTDRKNAEGEWKCRHGRFEKTTIISLEHGIVHSVDITLHGKVIEINQSNILLLECFSCWTPVGKSVDFFVNELKEDSVRQSYGDCYHKGELCSANKCTCSPEGNNFTWTLPTEYTNTNVSCEMTFIDEQMSSSSIQRATLFYDGKVIETRDNIHIPNSRQNPTNDSDPVETREDRNLGIIVIVSTGVCLLILIVTSIGIFKHCNGKKKAKNDAPESKRLTRCREKSSCSTCAVLVVYAVCIQCNKLFCHQCTAIHFKKKKDHELCGIEPENGFLTSGGKCTDCKGKNASVVCTKCGKVYCKNCTCSHDKAYFKNLSKNAKGYLSKSYQRCLSTVTPLSKIEIPRTMFTNEEIRIVGIVSLPDVLVLADRLNKKLVIFRNGKFFSGALDGKEPKAICRFNDNTVAVTMPYDNEILLYQIEESGVSKVGSIKLSTIDSERPIGRPYNITNDCNHFAVETGIGDDGMILIIDEKGQIEYEIPNKEHFGYFTGNTLRLALDWENHIIYVSALSKRAVSRIDFKGNIEWNNAVISPRDVISFQQENRQNLILCSKRLDTLYSLDPSNGNSEELFSEGRLSKPRFIAYNTQQKILYVNQGSTVLLYKLKLN